MEGGITEDNHLFFKLSHQPLKGVIRDDGRGARPPHDQPPLIEEQTEFAADNPPVIQHTFAANLLGATAFAHGVNEFNPISVDDPKHRRGGQEDLRPVVMGLQGRKSRVRSGSRGNNAR